MKLACCLAAELRKAFPTLILGENITLRIQCFIRLKNQNNHTQTPLFSSWRSGLLHDGWQMAPFDIKQIVTAMQISENTIEVEDAHIYRELNYAEVLVMVEALGPVRAAHLASKFTRRRWKECKGRVQNKVQESD